MSVKENLDTSTPAGRLMLTMIGAINEFERANLLERQREGIAIAKAKGKYKGRKAIEIDKSFIDTSIADENTRIITESIIFMAKRLGFETVAEGVESNEQYNYLKEIGCDCIQGYLLGKPMSKEDCEQLLMKQV